MGSEIVVMASFVRKKFVQDDEDCLLSMSAASCDSATSAVYKPSRTARRIDASRRCLSAALVKPHHAGEAYSSLASTTA